MKKEVVEQRLEDYVLHDDDDDDDDILTFGAWWILVDDDEIVEVQYPHERHSLASKESNHAKKQAMADFFLSSTLSPMVVKQVATAPNSFSFQSLLG